MPIPFECPTCGKKLRAPDDAAGNAARRQRGGRMQALVVATVAEHR